MIKVAINGFGRIGKSFLRAYLQDPQAQAIMQVVAINVGPGHKDWVAHLFRYDTFMGQFAGKVDLKDGMLRFANFEIAVLAQTDPAQIDWKALGVDWVVESSGRFVARDQALLHLQSGAKKVLITAIAPQPDVTVVLGVNDRDYDASKHRIVSMASCTANAFYPVLKVLHEALVVESVMLNVIHSYTNRQILMDIEGPTLRRSRCATVNIIPTDLSEPLCMKDLYPDFKGTFIGQGTRVPVAKVSLLDMTFNLKVACDTAQINAALLKASQSSLQGIVSLTNEPLVSSDFMNNPASVIIDESLTVGAGNLHKVFGWFDNEAGYAHRLKDFLIKNG